MSTNSTADGMTEGIDDQGRRRFLIAATTAVGAVGVGFTAVPFILSMQPSAKTQAAGAPVEVDISKIEPGQRLTVEWRGKPIWVVRRTEENLQELESLNAILRDPNSEASEQPQYAQNAMRSIKPEYLVVIGICTHLGCSPSYVKKDDPQAASLREDWKGGFFCPCHGSFFDLAGRVYKSVPAPLNLVVPPYTYLSETKIMVGVDHEEGAA